jgi:hypothetical protein
MFYEIVWEDGSVSVAEYGSDDEATKAVMEQHNRAKAGEKNGPQEVVASRAAKVFAYKDHPGSYNEEGTLTADEVKASVNDLLKGVDVVNVGVLSQVVANLVHPMQEQATPHDSKFKAEADHELELELA